MGRTKDKLCIEVDTKEIDFVSVHRHRMTILETISFLLYDTMDSEESVSREAYDLSLGLAMIDHDIRNLTDKEVNDE